MADNLTVKSSGKGAAPSADSSVAATPAVDETKAKLERLREVIAQRRGKVLSDDTLRSMVAKHEAKAAHEARIAESKSAFEQVAGKETIGKRSEELPVKAQKATGAAETRGADGLTEQDRTSIRSDPKSGPKLPPTDAKAATSEQAKGILEKVLGEGLLAGEGLDLAAFAKSLKQKPASKPMTQPPPGRTASSDKSAATAGRETASASVPSKASLPGAKTQIASGSVSTSQTAPDGKLGVTDRAPELMLGNKGGVTGQAPKPILDKNGVTGQAPKPMLDNKSGVTGQAPKPMAEVMSGVTGRMLQPTLDSKSAVTGTGAGKLAMSLRGTTSSSQSKGSAEAPRNAGGSLVSDIDLELLNLNFDALFAKVLLEMARDEATRKRMMRLVRQAAGEASEKQIEYETEFEKLGQEFERAQITSGLASDLIRTVEAGKRAAQKRVGGEAPEKASEDEKQLRAVLEKLPDDMRKKLGERAYLTEAERKQLSDAVRREYDRALSAFRRDAGEILFRDFLSRTRTPLSKDDPAAAELDRELGKNNDELRDFMMRDGDKGLRQAALGVRRQLAAELGEKIKNKADAKECAPIREQMLRIDNILRGVLPRSPETVEALKTELKAPEKIAEQPPKDEKEGSLKDWYRDAQVRYLKGEGKSPLEANPPTEAQRQDALDGCLAGDAQFFSIYDAHNQPNYKFRFAELAIGNVESANEVFSNSLTSGPLGQALGNIMQSASELTQKNRRELDNKARQANRDAQGMINQLVALMGLLRSGG